MARMCAIWLYVEDHVEAVQVICALLDGLRPAGAPDRRLNARAADRPGHEQRYAIGASKITREFGWRQRHSFEQGLEAMLRWSLEHLESFGHLLHRSDYGGDRIGLFAVAGVSGLHGNFV